MLHLYLKRYNNDKIYARLRVEFDNRKGNMGYELKEIRIELSYEGQVKHLDK